jgi:hypothetical protein
MPLIPSLRHTCTSLVSLLKVCRRDLIRKELLVTSKYQEVSMYVFCSRVFSKGTRLLLYKKFRGPWGLQSLKRVVGADDGVLV